MGLTQLIDMVKDLPEDKQNEIIDFAEFVAKKHGIVPARQPEPNMDEGMTFAQMLLSVPRLDASEWHDGLFERDQPIAKRWQNSALRELMLNPILVDDLTPLTRDETYDRNSDR